MQAYGTPSALRQQASDGSSDVEAGLPKHGSHAGSTRRTSQEDAAWRAARASKASTAASLPKGSSSSLAATGSTHGTGASGAAGVAGGRLLLAGSGVGESDGSRPNGSLEGAGGARGAGNAAGSEGTHGSDNTVRLLQRRSGSGSAPSGEPSAEHPPVLDELVRLTADLAAEVDDHQLMVQEVVASGGYGTVYRGMWQGLQVAVKTVLFSTASVNRRLALQEAALSKSISHPNIVATYAVDAKPLGSMGSGVRALSTAAGSQEGGMSMAQIQVRAAAGAVAVQRGVLLECLAWLVGDWRVQGAA